MFYPIYHFPHINEHVCSIHWIYPYISRHRLSLNPLLVRRRRYSRGKRGLNENVR
ncbi:hypothetical protein GNO56_24410 [Escherichia coli]|nr:hypothetical protein [Salmonella enterica subsp. enterica]EFH6738312.1 hypothetical protein [Escherichia coli]